MKSSGCLNRTEGVLCSQRQVGSFFTSSCSLLIWCCSRCRSDSGLGRSFTPKQVSNGWNLKLTHYPNVERCSNVDYSVLRAIAGSIEVARRTGIIVAASVAVTSTPPAAARTDGSSM
jgi:hypothetical protein